MLKLCYHTNLIEAGCDEAGRGCLAGPVFAAAVILPKKFTNSILTDSKQLNDKQRYELRPIIEKQAIAFAVAQVSNQEIDEINILNASILAMHRALDKLKIKAQHIIVDGNKFKPYQNTEHLCIVKGDSKYLNIAAASVLAKTYRDDFMIEAHNLHPHYLWNKNMGYPTSKHRNAIKEFGVTPLHRLSFRLLPEQLKLDLN